MSRYDAVVKMWQDWNVHTVDDLALRLDNFRILFAYNSGKIENAEINYHDTREIFENGKVVGYTGSTRTLFEQQNQKVCRAYYDALQAYDEQEDLTPLVQFLEAQTVKTWSRSTDSKNPTPHKKLNSFLLQKHLRAKSKR